MTASTSSKQKQTCFQLKTSFLPSTILQLTSGSIEQLEQQLSDTIARAPNFFLGSPVVLDLEKVQALGILDFAKIRSSLLKNGMAPVGVRGGSEEQHIAAASAGLPLVVLGSKSSVSEPTEKERKKSVPLHETKLVAVPIRSGMQVYAKEADLIVTAQVSPGAELLADGHIHVYGALRGRALAGMQGNTEARIFCRTLEAELVAIAGYYLTKEDMIKLPSHEGMMQIYLEDEQIKISSL